MTFTEAKQALCRKLNIDYSDIANNGLFTDTDLGDYVNTGILKAWDYRDWDFSEWAKTWTIASGDITAGYLDYPTDVVSGSITLLRIAGKTWKKLIYKDYVKWFEDNPNSQEKIWAEHRRFIFFNVNAASAADTIDVYGKLKAPQVSSGSSLMPFSPDSDNQEYSGNQAIVRLAYAEALGSEKKRNPQQAAIEEQRAYGMLDVLWKTFGRNRSADQSKNAPIFDVPDYFRGQGGNANTGQFTR